MFAWLVSTGKLHVIYCKTIVTNHWDITTILNTCDDFKIFQPKQMLQTEIVYVWCQHEPPCTMYLGNLQFRYDMIPLKFQQYFFRVFQKLGVVFFNLQGCEAGVSIHLPFEEIQDFPVILLFLPDLDLWVGKMEGLSTFNFLFVWHSTVHSEICIRFMISLLPFPTFMNISIMDNCALVSSHLGNMVRHMEVLFDND